MKHQIIPGSPRLSVYHDPPLCLFGFLLGLLSLLVHAFRERLSVIYVRPGPARQLFECIGVPQICTSVVKPSVNRSFVVSLINLFSASLFSTCTNHTVYATTALSPRCCVLCCDCDRKHHVLYPYSSVLLPSTLSSAGAGAVAIVLSLLSLRCRRCCVGYNTSLSFRPFYVRISYKQRCLGCFPGEWGLRTFASREFVPRSVNLSVRFTEILNYMFSS